MLKVKTAELTGAALDWAAAKCEELSNRDNAATWLRDYLIGFSTRYSTNWSQGGPIIECESISVGDQMHIEGQPEHSAWYATNRKGAYGFGTTPLIAAMRCYVASKLGDDVEIPKELAVKGLTQC